MASACRSATQVIQANASITFIQGIPPFKRLLVQLQHYPQILRCTPAWDAFGFVTNVVTKFCKQIFVKSSLQLLSRISQSWLPVDSNSTDPRFILETSSRSNFTDPQSN